MLLGLLFVFIIQVCWICPSLADPVPTVTIPFVAREPDYFKGYGGKVIGASEATTTYAVNCLPDIPCHGFTPDLTVVFAPSTYGLTAQGARFDLTSNCILVGSPDPTQATCIATTLSHADNSFITKTVIASVASDSSLGIYPAPLPVTATGTFSGSLAANTAPALTETQVLVATASTTGDGAPAITEPPIHQFSTDVGIYTATGSWIHPSLGNLTGYSNGTGDVRGASSHVGPNGTVTVTVTVLPSEVACQCLCESNNASLPGPTVTEFAVGKNYAVKAGTPVFMWGLLLVAVFWSAL